MGVFFSRVLRFFDLAQRLGLVEDDAEDAEAAEVGAGAAEEATSTMVAGALETEGSTAELVATAEEAAAVV